MSTRFTASIAIVAPALVFASPQHAVAQSAQERAEVCEVAEEHYAAIRNNDMEAVLDQHLPDFTFFVNDGGLLWSFDSLDQQRSDFEEPTFTARTMIRHCSAQRFGDVGIATYYLVGSVTLGDVTTNGTWRVTEVWVRQGNQWKEAHHHESPLLDAVSQDE